MVATVSRSRSRAVQTAWSSAWRVGHSFIWGNGSRMSVAWGSVGGGQAGDCGDHWSTGRRRGYLPQHDNCKDDGTTYPRRCTG